MRRIALLSFRQLLNRNVVPRSPVEQVEPGTPYQDIVAFAAEDLIVATAARQCVVARSSDKHVVAIAPEEGVVAGSAGEQIVTGAALEQVLFVGDRWCRLDAHRNGLQVFGHHFGGAGVRSDVVGGLQFNQVSP